MNLISAAPAWLVLLLAVLLVAAAVEDMVRLRISNIIVVGVLMAAGIAIASAGFPAAVWQNGLVFVGVLVIGTLAFRAGWLGGGDVKLLAALSLWVSLSGAVWVLAAVFLVGGVIAMLYFIFRPFRGRARGSSDKPITSRIPYGLAIAGGASIVFATQMGAFGPKHEEPSPFVIRAVQ